MRFHSDLFVKPDSLERSGTAIKVPNSWYRASASHRPSQTSLRTLRHLEQQRSMLLKFILQLPGQGIYKKINEQLKLPIASDCRRCSSRLSRSACMDLGWPIKLVKRLIQIWAMTQQLLRLFTQFSRHPLARCAIALGMLPRRPLRALNFSRNF